MPWTNLAQITPDATQFWQQGRFETKPETEICAWIDDVYLTALIGRASWIKNMSNILNGALQQSQKCFL